MPRATAFAQPPCLAATRGRPARAKRSCRGIFGYVSAYLKMQLMTGTRLAPGLRWTIKGTKNTFNCGFFDDPSDRKKGIPSARRARVACVHSSADCRDGVGRRRDAADRIRSLDRRMEARDRHAASALAEGMD